MKEADDGLGEQPAAGPEAGNGKIDKDMKGLVYQGGVPLDSTPVSSDTYPIDPPTSSVEPTEEKESGYKGIASPDGAKGDSILNFSEKTEGKGKIIALIIIGIIIVIGVVYLVTHSHVGTPKITIPTTTISRNAPTTTIYKSTAKSTILNLDILYNYTGPATINKTSCGKAQQSVVQSYSNRVNGSSTFLLYQTASSGNCPFTISKIYSTTPGFKVISVEPSIPQTIPAHSNIYFIMTISTPQINYTGPLSLTLNGN